MHKIAAIPRIHLYLCALGACTGSSSTPYNSGATNPSMYRAQTTHAVSTASTSALNARTSSLGASGAFGAGAHTAVPAPITGPRFVSVIVNRSLESGLDEKLGADIGTPLSQVTTRVLVWWVDIRKDIRRGDKIDLIYEPRPGEEPLLHALWFTSSKLGKTVAAVAYQTAGSPFARWYNQDGSEVELRLKDGPIENYEQITSLLNDGRHHKGIDFKTPVGTEVKAPWNGVVVRRNWGHRNGNCLELENPRTGHYVKLLHLDTLEPNTTPGAHVTRGQRVARSGNTGRSMAPHLHYQLEVGGHVVDPFKVQETWRAKLPPSEVETVKAMLAKYSAMRVPSPRTGTP